MISENTRNAWSFYLTFGTLSACRSFETKDYCTFSHCFYRISFCFRVYMYVLGMHALTVTAKANHSRQKEFAHGKSKSLTARTNSLKAKANQLRMRYFYSGGHSVLEVLLLFTAGHRYHSPCFPLTLASRVIANIVYF